VIHNRGDHLQLVQMILLRRMSFSMPRQRFTLDDDLDDGRPVMVPRHEKSLVTMLPERVERLREHLAGVLSAPRPMADPERPSQPEPQGFAAHVVRTACALCRGLCCKNGGDNGFLDEQTLARVRQARPEMNAESILQLYDKRVPAEGYAGSCIFHGKSGCTLDRSLRSGVCNSYFCDGLHSYLASGEVRTAVVVIAGEGNAMRSSPVLIP
jgi:hypothetical protein